MAIPENTLSYVLERAWCVLLRRDANELAVGFDEGIDVIKVYLYRLHGGGSGGTS